MSHSTSPMSTGVWDELSQVVTTASECQQWVHLFQRCHLSHIHSHYSLQLLTVSAAPKLPLRKPKLLNSDLRDTLWKTFSLPLAVKTTIDRLNWIAWIKLFWCKHETNTISQCEEENQMSALARVSLTERGRQILIISKSRHHTKDWTLNLCSSSE